MASIKIPTPLRTYTGGEAEVTVEGATVGEALDSLTAQFPELAPHILTDGQLRSFVNIFLKDEDVRHLDGMATSLDADARLRIIPSIAGGRTA